MNTQIVDNITKFRYSYCMTFKELLESKHITGYKLAKDTDIPYMTISDLLNCKTSMKNVSLKHAIALSDYLNVDIRFLVALESAPLIEFRYFRNNTLNDLKRSGYDSFIKNIYRIKIIDYYYKNSGLDRALYLLALIDYLSRINNKDINKSRYNALRKLKLDKPLFVGGDSLSFKSVEQAEKELDIVIIPEFKKHNIIEENVFNVA